MDPAINRWSKIVKDLQEKQKQSHLAMVECVRKNGLMLMAFTRGFVIITRTIVIIHLIGI
jgi:hypothetical protein